MPDQQTILRLEAWLLRDEATPPRAATDSTWSKRVEDRLERIEKILMQRTV